LINHKKGFSLIELLLVVAILGILLSIFIPNVMRVVYKARGAKIVMDMTTIRTVAMTYYNEKGVWPKNRAWGVVPKELLATLPPGTLFDLPGWKTSYAFTNLSNKAADVIERRGYTVALRIRFTNLVLGNIVYTMSPNLFGLAQFNRKQTVLTVVLD
jgi:prepilin-type N-terminal cleavage/methylation domain-containing protein